MIQEGWAIVKQAAEWYFSNGYFFYLFLFSIAMCFFFRGKKAKFVAWYVIIYSIVVLNPVSASVLTKLGLDGVYWRSFWLLPIGSLIAYVFVKIIFLANKKIIRGLLVICSVVVIARCGKFIYTADNFQLAENLYKIPDEVIEVSECLEPGNAVLVCSVVVIARCGKFIYTADNFQLAENLYKIPDEVIEVSECLEPGNAVLAPSSLIYWLRTYNADIYLPIGRQEYTFGGTTERNTLVSSLADSSVTDVKYITDGATQWRCRYIIVENNRQFEGEWDQYGYTFKAEAGKYQIYEKI